MIKWLAASRAPGSHGTEGSGGATSYDRSTVWNILPGGTSKEPAPTLSSQPSTFSTAANSTQSPGQ